MSKSSRERKTKGKMERERGRESWMSEMDSTDSKKGSVRLTGRETE